MEEIRKELMNKCLCNWFIEAKSRNAEDELVQFIQDKIDLAVSKELENERQFILNVLDGVDEADRQMGNIEGGTLAIRHALKSRTICK